MSYTEGKLVVFFSFFSRNLRTLTNPQQNLSKIRGLLTVQHTFLVDQKRYIKVYNCKKGLKEWSKFV